MTRVAVIGAGSWGTAVSALVAQNADEVVLWSHGSEGAKAINETHRNPRYLTDVELPANITATSDLSAASKGADAVVLATPSTHLRTISHELADTVGEELPVVVLTKGVEAGSGLLMSEVVADELGNERRVLALSGPNHAEEVSHGMFSCAVLASPDRKLAERMRPLVATPTFRVYVSEDIRGVETCGAVKNVIAIACGVCAGLGLGDIGSSASAMPAGTVDVTRADGSVARVRLVSVHTCSPQPGYWGLWRRSVEEIGVVRTRLAAAGSPGYVLLGDFNATYDHAPFRAMLGEGKADGLPTLHDAAREAGQGLVPTWPSGGAVPALCGIDHVVTSDGVAATDLQALAIPGSDHAALLATLVV